jgi:hypothetical protein
MLSIHYLIRIDVMLRRVPGGQPTSTRVLKRFNLLGDDFPLIQCLHLVQWPTSFNSEWIDRVEGPRRHELLLRDLVATTYKLGNSLLHLRDQFLVER